MASERRPVTGALPIRCPSIPTSPSEKGFYFDFSNGTKLSPLGIPSPISMYQHIRYPPSPISPLGSPKSELSYSYSPPSSPHPQRTASLPYSFLPGNQLGNQQTTVQQRNSDCYCAGAESCMCTRHHHRRNSVAIKFGDDPSLDRPRLDLSNDTLFETDEMLMDRRVSLKRAPSPIAEGILKGDFDF